MAILSNTGIRAGASGAVADTAYTIKRSTRFDRASSAYMNRTPLAASNRRTWTMSMWVKRNKIGTEYQLFGQHLNNNATDRVQFYFGASDQLYIHSYSLNLIITNRRFRDVGAWYHIVLTYDTTNGTSGDRIRLYINGVRETSFATENQPTQNADLGINTTGTMVIGSDITSLGTYYLDGQLADINFIDGTSLAGTDFGETDADTGQWVPKEYSGSYGTNGFHLAMDPANGGAEYSSQCVSGNGTWWNNNFTPLAAFNGTTSNYCQTGTDGDTITFTPNSGIVYSTSVEVMTAAASNTATLNGGSPVSLTADTWVSVHSGSGTLTSLVITHSTTPSLTGIKIDGKLLLNHTAIGYDSSGNKNHWHENNIFGREHTTANENFKVVTWTGDDSSDAITGVGFKPDLVWVKDRTTGWSHTIYDIVRGVGSDKALQSNSNAAEGAASDNATYGYLSSLDSNGFSYVAGSNPAYFADDGDDYIAWCWKAGGAGVANDTGTLDSTVSANTTAGFSIVKWNSSSSVSTVGHGLGKVPKMIITKNLDASNTWWTYHEGTGNTHAMRLDTTDAPTDQQSNWNDTSPTSSVFTVGGEWGNGNDVIAYCFADVEGHSKFSTYTGSGSSGNKVITGFRPAFVMVKRTTNISGSHMGWSIVDGTRGSDKKLQANNSAAENDGSINGAAGTDDVTFQPNGFTLASSSSASNGSGETYIYAAFAGHPEGDLDLLADTPGAPYDNELNGGGNYCTLNPLENDQTLSNGNLTVTAGGSYKSTRGTIGMSSGKFYWECTIDLNGGRTLPGISTQAAPVSNGTSWTAYGWEYFSLTGEKNTNDTSTAYGATYTDGDIIGVAFDADGGNLTFYKNGVSQGVAYTGLTSGPYFPTFSAYSSAVMDVNFGQRAFAYTPPTNYKALNTYNLPDPTITKGNTGFDILAYTGDGTATRTLTGLEFDPDMIWLKNRSSVVDHNLWDEVRGMGANKELVPNDTYSEGETGGGKPNTDAWGFIHDTTSDGFIVKEGTSGASVCNTNNDTYVAWCWDAGTANVTNDASSTGVGSIDSTYRVNTNTGFSIVTCSTINQTAETIAHGLNAVPALIIQKARTSGAMAWSVYHQDNGPDKNMNLNTNSAVASVTDYWGSSNPTSQVFGVAAGNNGNNQASPVYFCWSEVAGYSKFGKYDGNGSGNSFANGPFQWCGFKPKFIMLKQTSGTNNWIMLDTVRNPYNGGSTEQFLYPNLTNAENAYGGDVVDILSNGWRPVHGEGGINNTGDTYIWAAWAESPFKYNNAH